MFDTRYAIFNDRSIRVRRPRTADEKESWDSVEQLIDETIPEDQREFHKDLVDFLVYQNDEAGSRFAMNFLNPGGTLRNPPVVIEIQQNFMENVYDTLRKEHDPNKHKFKTVKDVYRVMNTNLLNQDKDFTKFVRDYFFPGVDDYSKTPAHMNHYLKHFGITKENHKALFFGKDTLWDIVGIMSNTKEVGFKEMYLFTAITNMLKEIYINNHFGKSLELGKCL